MYNPKLAKPKIDTTWHQWAKMKSEEKADLKAGCTAGFWTEPQGFKPVYVPCWMVQAAPEGSFAPPVHKAVQPQETRKGALQLRIPCEGELFGTPYPKGCYGQRTPIDLVCMDCLYWSNFLPEQMADWDADNEVAYSELDMQHMLEGHSVLIRDWRVAT